MLIFFFLGQWKTHFIILLEFQTFDLEVFIVLGNEHIQQFNLSLGKFILFSLNIHLVQGRKLVNIQNEGFIIVRFFFVNLIILLFVILPWSFLILHKILFIIVLLILLFINDVLFIDELLALFPEVFVIVVFSIDYFIKVTIVLIQSMRLVHLLLIEYEILFAPDLLKYKSRNLVLPDKSTVDFNLIINFIWNLSNNFLSLAWVYLRFLCLDRSEVGDRFAVRIESRNQCKSDSLFFVKFLPSFAHSLV